MGLRTAPGFLLRLLSPQEARDQNCGSRDLWHVERLISSQQVEGRAAEAPASNRRPRRGPSGGAVSTQLLEPTSSRLDSHVSCTLVF